MARKPRSSARVETSDLGAQSCGPMGRLLLRLLLIVSLVMNGVGAPWATALAADRVSDSTTQHESGSASISDCRHGGTSHASASMDHAHHGRGAQEKADARSCCDDAFCTCGCTLPPALSLPVTMLRMQQWAAAPVAGSVIRAVVRHAAPPLRPPAA
jgi:hypothetical protein